MQLTQQIKIWPTTEQRQVLWDLSEKCRLIYNFALKERMVHFKRYNKSVSYIDQQNQLPKIKETFPEYRWVHSKVLQYTLRSLDADFKSFFVLCRRGNEEARPPKFKGKKFFTTMVFNQSGYKHQIGWLQLSHMCPTKTRLRFSIPEKFIFNRIYQVDVYQKDGDFYLSVVYEQGEKEYEDNGLYQAFDLGVTKHTAVNSQAKIVTFVNKRPDRYWKRTMGQLQSRRDHCKNYSRKYKRIDKTLKRCRHKSTNQLRDFQHKLSRKVVDNTKANTIIVGKLDIKKMCKINRYEKGLHTSLQNTGNIARFVGFLTYKAKIVGKRVIKIDERKTSKRCCVCGNEQNMPLYKRIYNCERCGSIMDRDENSSINIMLRFLSQNGLWIAYQRFVGNLRQTGIAIQQQALHSQETPSLESPMVV